MTRRRVAAAAVLGLAAVVLVVALEVVLPRLREERADRAEILMPAATAPRDLEEVVVTPKDDRIELRIRDDGAWSLKSSRIAKDLVADSRAVEMIRAALAGTRILHEVAEDATEVGDLSPFGLAPPQVTLAWTTRGAARRTLALGFPTPDGRGTHALLDGTRLVVVPRSIFEACRWDVGHFRVKSLLTLGWDEFERLEVDRTRGIPEGAAPRVVFAPDDAPGGDPRSWRMKEPRDAAASTTRIASIASKLGTLLSSGFGAEEPGPADLEAAGLAPPAVTATIVDTSGRRHVVVLGKEGERPDTVWGRIDDGPLTMIRADLLDDLSLADTTYREARAFALPRWALRNVRLTKGRGQEVALELQSSPERGWHAVLPADADLPQDRVRNFLDRLDDVAVGRFEDELAADPAAQERMFSFQGLGSFLLQGTAELDDGSMQALTVEVGTPFPVRGELFLPIRTTDNAGRVSILIARGKAFDKALDTARELVSLATSAAELRGEKPLPHGP